MEQRHLDRARDALQQAREAAGGNGVVRKQLDSVQEGLFEEDVGDKTQDHPGPKIDRIAEMRNKLEGLAEEAEQAETSDHIADAREHLREYMRTHRKTGE